MQKYFQRIIRALLIDSSLYEEVKADTSAMGQAMSVVLLSSVWLGIVGIANSGLKGLASGVILALGGWFILAYIAYFIGTRFLPEPATKTSQRVFFRTIGFSSSPGILRVFVIVPILGFWINIATVAWMLAAMIIAVRHALDYKSTWRAVWLCIISFIVWMMLLGIVFGMFRSL